MRQRDRIIVDVHHAATPGGPSTGGESRDPTRPFRRPLLTVAEDEAQSSKRGELTDAEAEELQANVRVLLDNDRPSEAIRLLEDGVARSAHDAYLELRLRHFLAAALFFSGEYTRAAALFDVVGRDYARHLPRTDPLVIDCANHAGHAYAEIGNPDKALPQLRYYVHNANASASDDASGRIRESRFVIAQMFAASGRPDEALAELKAVRPLLVDAYGEGSTQVRNLDKQAGRLRLAQEGDSSIR